MSDDDNFQLTLDVSKAWKECDPAFSTTPEGVEAWHQFATAKNAPQHFTRDDAGNLHVLPSSAEALANAAPRLYLALTSTATDTDTLCRRAMAQENIISGATRRVAAVTDEDARESLQEAVDALPPLHPTNATTEQRIARALKIEKLVRKYSK